MSVIPTKPRAAIYCRISKDAEGREVGVENQRAEALALAEAHGYDVARVYIDNDTGASTKSRKKRPEYDALLADAERGEFGTIIAYSMSRLTRRPMEWEALIDLSQRHGVDYLYKVSPRYDLTTADGRATARTVAAWDAAEAERTGERVTLNQTAKRAKGIDPGGSRPFGFSKDRTALEPSEARFVKEAYRRILKDGATVYAVAKWLTESGAETAGTSKQWTPRATRAMLLRPRNAGILETLSLDEREENKRRKVRGQTLIAPRVYSTDGPQIVTPDEFKEMRALLTDAARAPKRGRKGMHLLSGIAKCVVCGYALAHTVSRKGKKDDPKTRSYAIYRCSNNQPVGRGTHPTMRDTALEDAVVTKVLERIGAGDSAPDNTGARISTIQSRLSELATESATATALGLIPGADLNAVTARLAAINAEREQQQADLDNLLADRAAGGAFEAFRAHVRAEGVNEREWSYLVARNSAWEAWQSLDLDAQRAILAAFRIKLHPQAEPERVTVDR